MWGFQGIIPDFLIPIHTILLQTFIIFVPESGQDRTCRWETTDLKEEKEEIVKDKKSNSYSFKKYEPDCTVFTFYCM